MGARVTTSAQKQGEVIERVKNTSAAFRVFELDDLITNLPLKSVHRQAMPADIRERLKKALSLCDGLVVITEGVTAIRQTVR